MKYRYNWALFNCPSIHSLETLFYIAKISTYTKNLGLKKEVFFGSPGLKRRNLGWGAGSWHQGAGSRASTSGLGSQASTGGLGSWAGID